MSSRKEKTAETYSILSAWLEPVLGMYQQGGGGRCLPDEVSRNQEILLETNIDRASSEAQWVWDALADGERIARGLMQRSTFLDGAQSEAEIKDASFADIVDQAERTDARMSEAVGSIMESFLITPKTSNQNKVHEAVAEPKSGKPQPAG